MGGRGKLGEIKKNWIHFRPSSLIANIFLRQEILSWPIYPRLVFDIRFTYRESLTISSIYQKKF